MIINLVFFLFLIYLFDQKACIKINISPNDSAFIKYQIEPNIKEIIFKQPLNERLKFSVSLGDINTTRELEKSKYKSTFFVDKQRLYMKSNIDLDYFLINSICKFDHEQLAAYSFDTVCCQATLIVNALNRTLDSAICKLEVGTSDSTCFLQLRVVKRLFTNDNEDNTLTLISNVFSSGDARCSAPVTHLAHGLPQRLVVVQKLPVKWSVTDETSTFGKLDIGTSLDSIDINSKTIFPLRIRTFAPVNTLNLECSFGSHLSLSTISFDGTNFGGEFIPAKQGHSIKIAVHKLEVPSQTNWNRKMGENLVNLEIKVSGEFRTKLFNEWISCRITRAKFSNSKSATFRDNNESGPIQVDVKINIDGLVIIPMTTEKTYFSILNKISNPIKLTKTDLKMFLVHSFRDGSLVTVTDKTQCHAISNASITCPSAFTATKNVDTSLTTLNWNILLTMESWQKLITYPIDVWQAEDWQTVIQDKILNKITNWRYYDSNTQTCRPMYQTTRCQLLARLVKETQEGDRIYFGQRQAKEFPLFDFTSHLRSANVYTTQNSITPMLTADRGIIIVPKRVGVSDISIRNNHGKAIGSDRVTVDDQPVTVTDLNVTCIHVLNVTQTPNRYNPTFRSIVVRSQESQSENEHCYVRIELVFSDGVVSNLQDFPSSNFKIVLRAPEESITISDLNSFVYQPLRYKVPGKFSISLYEPEKCGENQLIITKKVWLYGPKIRSTEKTRMVYPTSIVPVMLSVVNSTITNQLETTKSVTVTNNPKGIDMDSLFLSMKVLIGLVGLVILIVVLNCVIKIKQRKSIRLIDRQMNHCSAYSPIDKFISSTYAPIDISTPNIVVQHPPLLPPPGPLYNASDSSQLDLTVNATSDRFWDLAHKKSHPAFPMNQLGVYPHRHLPNRKVSPSPHSDSFDYSYLASNMPTNSQTSFHYPPDSNRDTDSIETGSSGKNCSQITVNVPPPCAPLRWNDNFCSNQFAVYYPRPVDVNTAPSHNSHDNSGQNSHSSSWEMKQRTVLPPSGFSNSIDNVCEKSSGVGSLTSTKPESDCSKKDSGCPSSPKTATYSMSP